MFLPCWAAHHRPKAMQPTCQGLESPNSPFYSYLPLASCHGRQLILGTTSFTLFNILPGSLAKAVEIPFGE